MSVRLERVTKDDIKEINRILKLAFRESFEKYRFCPAYEVSDEEVAAFLEKADAYKAIYEDTMIGAIFICKNDENQYELNTITILPEYQNKGLGNLAISMVEAFYPKDANWVLQTPEKDVRNRHLYEKHGYVEADSTRINEFLTLITYQKQYKENE